MSRKHTSSLDTSSTPPENPDELSAEQLKLTLKQRLSRLLMNTERRDKDLIPKLAQIKDEMHENFIRTGSRKSSYIDDIFRLYADKDQDITISKPQMKLFSQYPISIPDIPEHEPIRVTQYLKTLRFIRAGLDSMIHDIRPLVNAANRDAEAEIKKESTGIFHTNYDMEDEKQREHEYARKHLRDAMSNTPYNHDRLLQHQHTVPSDISANGYKDLMEFALLGFTYFNNKSAVYDAFLPEQLTSEQVSFTLPGFHPTTLSLGSFLKILEHLDFKRHLFAV